MRLIHNVQFSPQEVEFYRQLTFSNIVHGLKQLLEALDDMDLQIPESVEEHETVVSQLKALYGLACLSQARQ